MVTNNTLPELTYETELVKGRGEGAECEAAVEGNELPGG